MSVTASTCFQICNSPLNHSSSKQLYSFPKAQRFPQLGSSKSEVQFYDLPPLQDQRSAGIGYGTKYDFTNVNVAVPAPNEYTIDSEFAHDQKKNQGFIFGVSRDLMQGSGPMAASKNQIPGPGTYELKNTLSPIKYSFRTRTQIGDPILSQIKPVPGPGTYMPPNAISPDGQYFNSQFHSSGASSFNPPRSKRFPDNRGDKVPGPGAYTMNTGINDKGQYFVSQFQSSKCRTFSHDIRRTLASGTFLETPGPGNYRLPSEFGYYQAAKGHNGSQDNIKVEPTATHKE